MRRALFVCIGNRAHSQMAEGLLRHLAGERFEVYSEGTEPKSVVAQTVAVMRETGIDISGQRSKSVEELAGQEFDYVMTVYDSARQVWPTLPAGGTRLHWDDVEDPADAEAREVPQADAFRTARDDLRRRIEQFVLTYREEPP